MDLEAQVRHRYPRRYPNKQRIDNRRQLQATICDRSLMLRAGKLPPIGRNEESPPPPFRSGTSRVFLASQVLKTIGSSNFLDFCSHTHTGWGYPDFRGVIPDKFMERSTE
jgi:hypothetical protein